MRQAAKWLGLVALAISLLPLTGTLSFSQEPESLIPATLVKNESNILLQVEGILENSNSVLDDGRLYSAYTFEGRAGQRVAITLESLDFDTFVALVDHKGNLIASNDAIDPDAGNYHSFIQLTLPRHLNG